MFTVAPGLQPAMSGAAYHAAPGVSKSKLDDFAEKSPLHYWHKHIRPDREPEAQTEATLLGDAIHAAIGEPDTVHSRFVIVPADAPKRPTKSQLTAAKPSLESQGSIAYWKAFTEANPGKIILKPEQFAIVMGCRDACYGDPYIAGLLGGADFEQTYYAIDHETGGLIKCRADGLRLDAGLALDFKSTEDASADAFWKSARKYRYDVQDPFYTDTINQAVGSVVVEEFAFIVVEKAPPHATAVYFYTPEERAAGLIKARTDLRGIRDYTMKFGENRWPSYTEHGAQRLQSSWDRARNA